MRPSQLSFKLFFAYGIDIVLIVLSIYTAYLLRFDFSIPKVFLENLVKIMPLIVTVKIACFHFFDLYRGMWRFTSIPDLLNVIKAASLSSLIIIAGILVLFRFQQFPRSTYAIDWLLIIMLLSGIRITSRIYFQMTENSGEGIRNTIRSALAAYRRSFQLRQNLLIIGAGNCGETICREISSNEILHYNIIGFLDDDPQKRNKKIHGISILGSIDELNDLTKKIKVDEILIAIPSSTSAEMRRIVNHCEQSQIPYKTLPSYGELINGRVTVKDLREVAYRDLLRREPVNLDQARIGAYLRGNSVVVTGAAGSIGSELCRQICRFKPQNLILYERAESPLYEIELELHQKFPDIEIVTILGDILDHHLLQRTFEHYVPQTVFHAAAYKHVPMLEIQPWRAVINNIVGTQRMVEMSKRFKVERFVFVSTDKAVRPANIMGASKRIAEMLVQCHDHKSSDTKFMTVRFGNVVGSIGSVVPLFKKQIAEGGPITVTHPEVTRYFMTIPEACQLILQAGAMGEGREIFILEMGTPIRIIDMARDLIRLSGLEPEVDIKIELIGLRPGEKLHEELITAEEGIVTTDHDKILVLKGQKCNISDLLDIIDELRAKSLTQDTEGLRAAFKTFLPEYQPDFDHHDRMIHSSLFNSNSRN